MHGAEVKRKQCSYKEGCDNYAQKGGVCVTHGAMKARKRKQCCFEGGCDNIAQKGGVCKRHATGTDTYTDTITATIGLLFFGPRTKWSLVCPSSQHRDQMVPPFF
jgi:hypothetical protein